MKNLLLILSLFITTQALAFRLNTNIGAAFDNEVKVYVTSNSDCDEAGISKSELLDIAMEGAEDYWNNVPSADLTLKRGGTYSTSDGLFLTGELCVNDSSSSCSSTTIPTVNDIVIACNSNTTNFSASNILAISSPIKFSGDEIKGSIVLINNTAGTGFANLSYSEKVSVLAHEIGHALGLGHTKETKALMYYKVSEHRFALSQDDVDGITYLYPKDVEDLISCDGLIPSAFGEDSPHQKTSLISNLLSFLYGLLLVLIFYRIRIKK